MSGGYNPKVSNPYMSNDIPQMRSGEFQVPFFFGGSQVPFNLGLKEGTFSGSGMSISKPNFKSQVIRTAVMPNQLRK